MQGKGKGLTDARKAEKQSLHKEQFQKGETILPIEPYWKGVGVRGLGEGKKTFTVGQINQDTDNPWGAGLIELWGWKKGEYDKIAAPRGAEARKDLR